ncbi:transmembrane protein 126A [Thalassophryne amazonica]|uniref:transmembrane protein 126A n=1 Tax=Thalassophryne amazonica TaxID=390379 RepID=UPI00147162DC|nr:transmembrane protein 126A [Thalassophryne amazonica]
MHQGSEIKGGAGHAHKPTSVFDLMSQNINRLPAFDQKIFMYGHVCLAGNASIAGLVAHSLFRRSLNVSQAAFTSALPMAVLPYISTYALYAALVSGPLLSDDLQCGACAVTRGALIGLVGGGLYPILLALPVNLGLAVRYYTTPMPEKGNVLRFWMDISRPILKKTRAVLVVQCLFGTFLGHKNFDTYTKLIQLSFPSDGEELED